MWVSSEPAIDKAYRQTQTRLATVSSAIKAWRHQAGPWEHAAGFQPVPQVRLARLEITKDRNSAWVGPHILPITTEDREWDDCQDHGMLVQTKTGRHSQLHNPHPAQPGSPSWVRNPVCRRNLLVALDIALLGKGPHIHLEVETLATASLPHCLPA